MPYRRNSLSNRSLMASAAPAIRLEPVFIGNS
jgi:hypothetical protein